MIQFGRKLDTRDGRWYRTVLMPDGNWWTENLDYAGEGGPGIPGAGRLYTISEANAACIAGCRVPTQEGSSGGDWYDLVQSLDESASVAGDALKSTSGWSINGTDKYGFNAKPSGIQHRTYPISAWDPISATSAAFWIGYLSAPYSGLAWIKGGDSFISLAGSDSNEVVRGAVRLIVDSGNIPDPIPKVLKITGAFDNSTITSTAVNRLGETVPSFVVNNGDGTVSVFLDGNPDGDYRICIMQNNKVTPWIDFRLETT